MLDDENSDFDSGGLVLIWYDAITVCPTSFWQMTSGLLYDRFIEETPAPILINLLIDVLQTVALPLLGFGPMATLRMRNIWGFQSSRPQLAKMLD